jgi:hypothetical protein
MSEDDAVSNGNLNLPSFGNVRAKLDRAFETLGCLRREIERFLDDGPGPMSFNRDAADFARQVRAHSNRALPMRFSILSGEVVHHLRSCLDHIIWALADSQVKSGPGAAKLEFPIFHAKPSNKSSFDRKIAGVPDGARQIIERLQPYHRPEAILTGPLNDPLWVIHDLDRVDKHRELTIAICAFSIATSGMPGIHIILQRYAGRTEDEIAALAATLDPE